MPKKFTGKDRRKKPVKLWGIEMETTTFLKTVGMICVTALFLFSFAFSFNVFGIQCGNKPQKIPERTK
jgi:hypothetical protein